MSHTQSVHLVYIVAKNYHEDALHQGGGLA